MPSPPQLSRRERQLMDILFSLESATTAQIREQMEDPPSANAVRTLLQILETKGHLRKKRIGREYLFSPTKPRSRAGLEALQHVLSTFYEGSIENALTAHLTQKRSAPTEDDYHRLMKLIEQTRQSEKDNQP